jgi:hypothetical protein
MRSRIFCYLKQVLEKVESLRSQLIRYLVVGALSYLFVTFLTIYSTLIFPWSTQTNYAIVLLSVIAFDYLINIKVVFRSIIKPTHLILYPIYILISWFLAVAIFSIINRVLPSIALSHALVLSILFPLRFWINRKMFS